MKKLSLTFIVLSLSILGLSQTTPNKSREVFIFQNQARYDELSKAIKKLPINSCILNKIMVTVSIDSSGATLATILVQETYNPIMDSLIIETINNFEGKWTPFMTNGKAVNTKMRFDFYITRAHKTITNSTQRNSRSKTVSHGARYDYRKNCDDADYYFDNAAVWFNKGKYKYAKNDFINALKSNPNDLEAQYNLGMCYMKLEKFEKACESFQICAKYGNNSAAAKIKEICK